MKFFLSILCFALVVFASNVQDDIANSFDNEYTQQTKKDFDPLSGYNNFMTNVNDKFYMHILFPVAKGYEKITPKPVRESVSNFFHNLFFPVRFTNNILQLKFKNSFEELERFTINSTVGVAGLFDIAAKKMKIYPHEEDFGQTLGFYGLGGGFHIVLPILGQSNLRDTVGLVGDWYLDPKIYIQNRGYNLTDNGTESFGASSFNVINRTSFDYKKYEAIKKGNVLLYPVLKDLYEKHRNKLIKE
jgi:phospholipid-binding lipoprotein MlaA